MSHGRSAVWTILKQKTVVTLTETIIKYLSIEWLNPSKQVIAKTMKQQ